MIHIKYHVSFVQLRKQNLKMLSATNCRWGFKVAIKSLAEQEGVSFILIPSPEEKFFHSVACIF